MTDFSKRLKSYKARVMFNFWPCYWGSGGKVLKVAYDFSYLKLKVPLNWRTRNYVGTIYGGSLFGAIDPIYMLLFIQNMGRGYIVWDKSAHIEFLKPGRETVFAEFMVTPEQISELKGRLETEKKIEQDYPIELKTKSGECVARITKRLYFRKKEIK